MSATVLYLCWRIQQYSGKDNSTLTIHTVTVSHSIIFRYNIIFILFSIYTIYLFIYMQINCIYIIFCYKAKILVIIF